MENKNKIPLIPGIGYTVKTLVKDIKKYHLKGISSALAVNWDRAWYAQQEEC